MPTRVSLLVLLLGTVLQSLVADSSKDLEHPVKAAMLYNFTRFVEWPASTWRTPKDPMVVCIWGSGPVGRAIEDTLRGKTYQSREIQVSPLHSPDEIGKCQVLFITTSEKKHLGEILRSARSASVLTISDIDDFVLSGGMIGFIVDERRVKFEISSSTASKAGLVVSSKLLSLSAGQGGR